MGVGQIFIYLPLRSNFLRIKVSKIEKENDIPTMVEEEEEEGGGSGTGIDQTEPIAVPPQRHQRHEPEQI